MTSQTAEMVAYGTKGTGEFFQMVPFQPRTTTSASLFGHLRIASRRALPATRSLSGRGMSSGHSFAFAGVA
jgi:hypothetical protein